MSKHRDEHEAANAALLPAVDIDIAIFWPSRCARQLAMAELGQEREREKRSALWRSPDLYTRRPELPGEAPAQRVATRIVWPKTPTR